MRAKQFTLMGYGETLSWPTIKGVDTGEPAAVIAAARQFLDDAPLCDRIEIWSGSELIHTVRRAA